MDNSAIGAIVAPTDGEMFGEWVRPHIAAMFRLAARMTSPPEADDIVQEALTRAWLKARQYDPARGRPSAWLLAITANLARSSRRRRMIEFVRDFPPTNPSPHDEEIDLAAALKYLSPRKRLAIDCYYFVGLSIDETAAVMCCSSGTVKSTLHDARASLRERLESTNG